jgi:hypothetical protein
MFGGAFFRFCYKKNNGSITSFVVIKKEAPLSDDTSRKF